MTLPLRGVASEARGFDITQLWKVIRVRDACAPRDSDSDFAIIKEAEDIEKAIVAGHSGGLVIGSTVELSSIGSNALRDVLIVPENYGYIGDGDLIGYEPSSRKFRTLYRKRSNHNSFFVTERCDNFCLMCSQPPRQVNDSWMLDEINAALPLVDPTTQAFSFTGGEPLLDWERFVGVLMTCRDVLPDTAVHVLTNGRAFSRNEVVAAWAGVSHPKLMAGIPLYSSVDQVHDYVVQAKGAYDETLLGVLKLKDRGQRVELRIVLHAITGPHIADTCRWIARNLPFVDHVALMGMEHTGFALANEQRLWIDPLDYASGLADGVFALHKAGVRASVYNLPRCLIPRPLWPSAVQSISDWKNGFLPECEQCSERPRCSGFFTSGKPRRSRGITPLA
ncbi:MAG: His-Xaa-Ser system radical SAM maturase HxsC [Nitrobacter sp.]|uniref:His-Xaa-Ser system radical SAM maturase HxsC n=1 Tax=Nitrobacter sp. TaxID=29420 RepID=UPI00261B918E|nr:His-Xaa-Ser system radical SAM maturase HxsC [Nitrobacter sp.]MCV0387081.1 His-Xaa-Ser system radical SAM maturase HxsC [Nitrobacter sp.]